MDSRETAERNMKALQRQLRAEMTQEELDSIYELQLEVERSETFAEYAEELSDLDATARTVIWEQTLDQVTATFGIGHAIRMASWLEAKGLGGIVDGWLWSACESVRD